MQKPKRRGCVRFFAYGIGVLMLVCVIAASASAISNTTLPKPPAQLDRLTDLDRARLAEAVHLKTALGDEVWPGWGSADIPVIIWNSEYAFLYGMANQPPGGWEQLEDETFGGLPVYRRGDAEALSAFTEQLVDGTWTGSMSTKYEVDEGFIDQMHKMIFSPLNEVVPYRFFILPSEVYMSGVLHETFHAYQAMTLRSRFDDAESAYPDRDRYAAADETMHAAWSREVDLLIRALDADSGAETADLVRQFLEARAQRRAEAVLDDSLVLYEKRFEWLEGLAKYVEMGIYEAAVNDASYMPVSEMAGDSDFQEYATWDQRWLSEMMSMRNMATQEGDVRFYYTGMVEARLLDRLMPGWKERVGDDGVWLEDLLGEVAGP